ncbi:hypothetical protein NSU_3555 [Novosphingobium pentaromativorans US6-1]|uniref:Uncharacterized protein n=1 Tax=Novosphingobium pentaromativorans US6-1 TaxID=1088721 RepID=G6EGT4_9SPHN|nr:hypothetical protein NSU_3555 [Novosphingobium pentaromativorans US6-1]
MRFKPTLNVGCFRDLTFDNIKEMTAMSQAQLFQLSGVEVNEGRLSTGLFCPVNGSI